jgi:hypothetical protein
MKGRKPKQESRAVEFRHRLVEWKHLPEHVRPSLRALAIDLGTSHQLLQHYLDGLEKWQAREDWSRAREIRARARAENRLPTPREEQEADRFDRMARRRYLDVTMDDLLRDVERKLDEDVRVGRPLAWDQFERLKIYAKAKFPGAQGLLNKYAQVPVGLKPSRQQDPNFRLFRLISRLEKRGGILLLDEAGELVYFVPSADSQARAVLGKLYERRGEIKPLVAKQIQKLGPEKYEEIKAKICQRISPSVLSPLDKFRDTGATLQRGLGEKDGDLRRSNG